MNYFIMPGLKEMLMQDLSFEATKIIEAVSDYYKIPFELLKRKTRKQEVILARKIASHLLHKNAGLTLSSVGKLFGNQDHTTIIHAINSLKDLRETEHTVEYDFCCIYNKLYINKKAGLRSPANH